MTFTTPCFVRVENPEKRKELFEWLCEIGYIAAYRIDKYYPVVVTGLTKECVDIAPESTIEGLEYYGMIDCGENTELFKALAAMNDENDREQWFVSNEGSEWAICKKTLNVYSGVLCRKATAEEIVEYFKNKER